MATMYDWQKQTAVSELQSTWTLQSMNTLLWADEELWFWDTRATMTVRWEAWMLCSLLLTFMWLTLDHNANQNYTSGKCVCFIFGVWEHVLLLFCLCVFLTGTQLSIWLTIPCVLETNICSRNGTRLHMNYTGERLGQIFGDIIFKWLNTWLWNPIFLMFHLKLLFLSQTPN